MLSSYFTRAVNGESNIIANRDTMTSCFTDDVVQASKIFDISTLLPSHTALTEQEAFLSNNGEASLPLSLRILQWNINCLYGPDTDSKQDGRDLLALIALINPDIVLIQEANNRSMPDDPHIGNAKCFSRLLSNTGYSLFNTCGVYFSMVAIRNGIPIDNSRPAFWLHDTYDDTGCIYLSISLKAKEIAASPMLGILGTHLTYKNYTPPLIGQATKGVRFQEVTKIVNFVDNVWHECNSLISVPNKNSLIGAILATDYNQAREIDKSPEHWSVLSQGVATVGEPTDDGVAQLLQENGYTCTYDVPSIQTNYRSAGKMAPDFTHWTGSTIDFCYLWQPPNTDDDATTASIRPVGSYVIPSPLSDHLPIVTDFEISYK